MCGLRPPLSWALWWPGGRPLGSRRPAPGPGFHLFPSAAWLPGLVHAALRLLGAGGPCPACPGVKSPAVHCRAPALSPRQAVPQGSGSLHPSLAPRHSGCACPSCLSPLHPTFCSQCRGGCPRKAAAPPHGYTQRWRGTDVACSSLGSALCSSEGVGEGQVQVRVQPL